MRIAIIGGGAVGSSVAYHLARRAGARHEITVVERDPSYARASSALSASSIREQFSTPINIAMSQYGLEFLRAASVDLAVAEDRPDLSLRLGGYLFLASEAGVAALRENHAVQRDAGADVALLTPAEMRARFPWIATEGVALGSLGLSREGWFDGPGLLAALRRKARALGVTYRHGVACGFAGRAGAVGGVRLAEGGVVACDVAVNAAGAWAAVVADWLGIDLPIRPRRRSVFVVSCRTALPDSPLVIDPSGVWFRPEGDRYLAGCSPRVDEDDPDEPPLEVEHDLFADRVWPAIAARVPAFEAVRVTGAWAGYYEMNLFDHNGFVGAHDASPDVIHAAGFSGHGMQHAPAVGRAVAELILDDGYRTLDLTPLSPSRLAAGRRIVERNVV